MKIAILEYDLSDVRLRRSDTLARVLMRKYEVEIFGFQFRKNRWLPYETEIKYNPLRGKHFPFFISSVIKGLNKLECDVIYASKYMLSSYGFGLLKKRFSGLPLILDIDDWTLGIRLGDWNTTFLKAIWREYIKNPARLFHPHSIIYIAIMEHFIDVADEVTVTSRFLQRKFGGNLLPHAVDTKFCDPNKFNRKRLKEKWGIKNKKIIMFLGNPATYKGIEDILMALKKIKKIKINLMMVGANKDQAYVKMLIGLGKENIILVPGPISSEEIPKFLSMADLVILPQRDTPATVGQVPMKIIDAMAMAKPIIATNVSDLPEILDNCGLIVEPSDINALSENILYLVENEKVARELGKKAREKCIKQYSFDAMGKKLVNIFDKYQ